MSQQDPYGINAEVAYQAREAARAKEAWRQELLLQQYKAAQQESEIAAIRREHDDLQTSFTSWLLKHDIPPDRIIAQKVNRFKKVRYRAWYLSTLQTFPDYGSGASYRLEKTEVITNYLCEDGQVRSKEGRPAGVAVHEMRAAIVKLVKKYGIPFD